MGIVEEVITVKEEIPFETITKDVSNGENKTNKVIQAGKNGLREVTYKVKYKNRYMVKSYQLLCVFDRLCKPNEQKHKKLKNNSEFRIPNSAFRIVSEKNGLQNQSFTARAFIRFFTYPYAFCSDINALPAFARIGR